MSHAYHRYLEPTLDPDIRKCAVLGCKAVARVAVTRPAPSVVGSPTSEEAARKAEGTRHRTRTLVWNALLAAGVHGLTDEGGCEVTGLDASTYRPRRVELVEDGLVRAVGTRPSRHGRQMAVWIARTT